MGRAEGLNDILTVVTPTKNADKYFEGCLTSVAALQRRLGVRHLVVDDGSVDNTLALADAAGATVLDGRRKGLYAAMNLGVQHVSTPYYCVLAADDLLFAEPFACLLLQVASAEADWGVGGLRWIDEHGRDLGTLRPPPTWVPSIALATLGWGWLAHPASVYSIGLHDRLGAYDESFAIAADLDYAMRALRISPFVRRPQPCAAFRRHEGSLSLQAKRNDLEGHRIAREHGLVGVQGHAVRMATKLLVQALNPTWSLKKRQASWLP